MAKNVQKINSSKTAQQPGSIVEDAQPIIDQPSDDESEGACGGQQLVVAQLSNALSVSNPQNDLTPYRLPNAPNTQVINVINGQNIHIGQNIVIPQSLTRPTTNQQSKKDKIPRTTTIDTMMRSTTLVDEEFLDCVAKNLGVGWQAVLRRLGQTDAFIEQLDRDFCKDGTRETIYKGLLDWMRNAERPTIGTLVSILWSNDHRECVVELKKYFKMRKF